MIKNNDSPLIIKYNIYILTVDEPGFENKRCLSVPNITEHLVSTEP